MLKTPCRGAASTCLGWESRYPWGTVSLCQLHAAQDLPKSVLSFLVTFVLYSCSSRILGLTFAGLLLLPEGSPTSLIGFIQRK